MELAENCYGTVMELGWNLDGTWIELEGTIHIVHRVSYLLTAGLFINMTMLGCHSNTHSNLKNVFHFLCISAHGLTKSNSLSEYSQSLCGFSAVCVL